MLQQALLILLIAIITFAIALTVKVILPLLRFLIRADSIFEMYNFFKALLEMDFSSKDEHEVEFKVSYGQFCYKKKIEFSNAIEASVEYEKLILEALDYYEKLGQIAIINNSLKVQQKKLLHICSEIRSLRWQITGVN